MRFVRLAIPKTTTRTNTHVFVNSSFFIPKAAIEHCFKIIPSFEHFFDGIYFLWWRSPSGRYYKFDIGVHWNPSTPISRQVLNLTRIIQQGTDRCDQVFRHNFSCSATSGGTSCHSSIPMFGRPRTKATAASNTSCVDTHSLPRLQPDTQPEAGGGLRLRLDCTHNHERVGCHNRWMQEHKIPFRKSLPTPIRRFHSKCMIGSVL